MRGDGDDAPGGVIAGRCSTTEPMTKPRDKRILPGVANKRDTLILITLRGSGALSERHVTVSEEDRLEQRRRSAAGKNELLGEVLAVDCH